MSKSVMRMAMRYYPEHWTVEYLDALRKKGALTQDEYDAIVSKGDGAGDE